MVVCSSLPRSVQNRTVGFAKKHRSISDFTTIILKRDGRKLHYTTVVDSSLPRSVQNRTVGFAKKHRSISNFTTIILKRDGRK